MRRAATGPLTGRRWRAAAAALALLAAVGVVVGITVGGAGASSRCTSARAVPSGSRASARQQERVLDAAYARMLHGPACLGSPGNRDVVDYGIGRLWSRGIDGAGTTIALAEGWDDPSIDEQVAAFDRLGRLPNPQIRTIYPSGDHRLPARCPSSGAFGSSCSGEANELRLDVLSAHLMAPYARIVIFVTPPDSEVREDATSQGTPPEMMQGVEAISRRHLANVISISYGSGEGTYRYGRDEVTAQDPGELSAAAAGIPVAVATGDCGPVQPVATATQPCAPVTGPEISTWDDSPWTLAVGGSTPSATGSRVMPGFLPENAGFSSIFARPGYQNAVASVTRSRWRSVPDITMDNSSGTSESAPLMAGVLALATQANGGRDLGPINTALYDALGPRGAADGIVDITRGNDSLTSTSGKLRVRGFSAHRGFDVASGWGTIDAFRFVPALVRATRASHTEATSRAQAAGELTALRRAIRLSPAVIDPTTTSHLTATGFLPRFPVTLSVNGRKVAVLHADDHGDVTDTLEPARLHLQDATDTVTLRSMLITVTGHLTVR